MTGGKWIAGDRGAFERQEPVVEVKEQKAVRQAGCSLAEALRAESWAALADFLGVPVCELTQKYAS